jgi:tetratricopeptide (TPR) repeat protein
VMLFAQGLIADSLADFEEAIRVDDSLAQAHVNRGYTLMALMRWADSIAAFDRGISLGSEEQAKAHFNRGIAHEELDHVREAYQDYLKASELDPLWEEPKQELTRFSVRPRGAGGG